MNKKKIDWIITLVPVVMIVFISIMFFAMPEQSNDVLGSVRFFFGDTLGAFYIVFGLGVFLLTLYFAFSKYGCRSCFILSYSAIFRTRLSEILESGYSSLNLFK